MNIIQIETFGDHLCSRGNSPLVRTDKYSEYAHTWISARLQSGMRHDDEKRYETYTHITNMNFAHGCLFAELYPEGVQKKKHCIVEYVNTGKNRHHRNTS